MNIESVIRKKIKRKMDKVAQDAMEICKDEILAQIENHFELYIEEFYEDYPNPVWYQRTGMTYYGSDSFDVRSVGLSRPDGRVGIYVSAVFINGNPYTADKDWVFENTFELGRHGYPPHEGHAPMSPPPNSRMESWFKDFKNNKGQVLDKIKENAIAKALQKNKLIE